MSFDNIRLEKGMYGTGRSFTQTLESLDPSDNYKGTELEGLDAYERKLKRFNIKPTGADSSVLGKFFQTSNAAVLFPEYVSRAVRYGMDEASFLPDIVATVTNIDSMDYRVMDLNMTKDNATMNVISEGEVLANADFTVSDRTIRLKKRGRMITTSYDVLRFQRLDVVSIALKRIGAYLAQSLMADAIDVLINGDGGNNAAKSIALSTSAYTYAELIDFWTAFAPYELNTILASPTVTSYLLKMEEFRDAAAGLNFHGTGKLITPFGANLIRTSHITNPETMIGLDKNCALEMVKVGDIETDYGKLVDRQLDQIAITAITGFAKILPDSVKITHTDGFNTGDGGSGDYPTE
ncbi:MAG: phage major capsid protein [Clostridia bacterium]|nr:phage major capsid protein [Clostridia bacterium]